MTFHSHPAWHPVCMKCILNPCSCSSRGNWLVHPWTLLLCLLGSCSFLVNSHLIFIKHICCSIHTYTHTHIHTYNWFVCLVLDGFEVWLLLVCFWNRVCLCSLGCHWICFVNQAGLKFRDSPSSVFWELVVKSPQPAVWTVGLKLLDICLLYLFC